MNPKLEPEARLEAGVPPPSRGRVACAPSHALSLNQMRALHGLGTRQPRPAHKRPDCNVCQRACRSRTPHTAVFKSTRQQRPTYLHRVSLGLGTEERYFLDNTKVPSKTTSISFHNIPTFTSQ